MSSEPDTARINAAVAGDDSALAVILEHYRADLERYVARRAGAVVLAKESEEDIVQSACREVIARLPKADFVGGAAGFRAWLFQAALRKLLDRHRYYKQAKRDIGREFDVLAARSTPSKASLSSLLGALGSPSQATPSGGVVQDEELTRLAEAVDSLADDQRLVVELAYFQACPHREIAELIGRSETAVRSLLARALARIARKMLT